MRTPEIQHWIPTPEEENAFRETDATFDWLCNLPKELLEKYSGKWVAARNCAIIASGDSMDTLLVNLKETDLSKVIIDRLEQPAWKVYR